MTVYHLYNDFSGSPRALRDYILKLLEDGQSVRLVTSKGGVLDNINHKNLYRKYIDYRFTDRIWLTALRYVKAQFMMFFDAVMSGTSDWRDSGVSAGKMDSVIINTILPVGAALGAKIRGKEVTYYFHEDITQKGLIYKLLAWIMQIVADKIICVSKYQTTTLRRSKGVIVVPNHVSDELQKRLTVDPEIHFACRRVLMLSSLKHFKGINEFVELANCVPEYEWELVLNAEERVIERWISKDKLVIPSNLKIFSRTDNIAEHYNRASIVVNLSDSRKFIETSGMTIIEALAAGIPVIVPETGGVAKLVEDGVNGYKIDCRKMEEIVRCIRDMLGNRDLYFKLAGNR